MRTDADAFVQRYDAAILDPDARSIYDGSDFYNVGDWSDGPSGRPGGLGEAARRLVQRHLSVDRDDDAAKAAVVLDVGCGLGAGARMMASHYPQALVLGVNLSPTQTAHAARSAPAARFAVMDATRLAVADGSVDRIHCVEAAFHFDCREDFLVEAHRALRPGGLVIVTDILFRRGYGESIPPRNIWTGLDAYAACCGRAKLTVDKLVDITADTLTPFYAYLAMHGRRAEAVLLRRSQTAYLFAVLRKPV